MIFKKMRSIIISHNQNAVHFHFLISQLETAGPKSSRHSLKFSIVFLQKVYISAIFHGSLHVIIHKAFKQFRRNPSRMRPFKNREVFGMLTFLATVDQPNVYAFTISIYSEFVRINKLLLFPATSTAKIYSGLFLLRYSQCLRLRHVSGS